MTNDPLTVGDEAQLLLDDDTDYIIIEHPQRSDDDQRAMVHLHDLALLRKQLEEIELRCLERRIRNKAGENDITGIASVIHINSKRK